MAAGSWVLLGLDDADLELRKNWLVNLEAEQESEQICSAL